jgi:hypothetical protein
MYRSYELYHFRGRAVELPQARANLAILTVLDW